MASKKYYGEPIGEDDLRPSIALARKVLFEDFKNGYPKYENTQDGLEMFKNRTREYLDFVEENTLIADVEGWASFCGISRQTIFNYERRGGEWHSFIDKFKGLIASEKKQLALKGKIAPVFAMFDMVNNHGYVNTNEFHISTKIEAEKPQLTAEQLIERSRQLPGFSEETSLIDEKRIPNDIFDREIIDGEFVTIDKPEEMEEDTDVP